MAFVKYESKKKVLEAGSVRVSKRGLIYIADDILAKFSMKAGSRVFLMYDADTQRIAILPTREANGSLCINRIARGRTLYINAIGFYKTFNIPLVDTTKKAVVDDAEGEIIVNLTEEA